MNESVSSDIPESEYLVKEGKQKEKKHAKGKPQQIRTEPFDLQEKLAMDEAKTAKDKKIIIPAEKMDNPIYKDTHDKQSHVHNHKDGTKTEVHNIKERSSGIESEFKFKARSNDRSHLPQNKE